MTSFSQHDGWIAGAWRNPVNNSGHEAGTIHDDTTAKELGFRSGTIAGSIHMEQFLPLCEHVFGQAWQRTGALSLYFTNPSIDGEAVQARISIAETSIPPMRRRVVSMQTSRDLVVLEGSATIGGDDTASVVKKTSRAYANATGVSTAYFVAHSSWLVGKQFAHYRAAARYQRAPCDHH